MKAPLDSTVRHFGKLLEANGVDLNQVKVEWSSFKVFWFENLKVDKRGRDEVWATFFRLSDNYSNLRHVINILMIYPVSNATVERGFSTMRRIKSDWRNKLQEKTLECLMRISIEGPTIEEFDSSAAVQKFFEKPRHTSIEPYGKRKTKDPLAATPEESNESESEPDRADDPCFERHC